MRSYKSDAELGEKAVKAWTNCMDKVQEKWLPADKDAQMRGIDIVTSETTYEVKNKTLPNAIVIEERDGLRQGWIYTSEAEYLIEVDLKKENCLKIKMADLRRLYFLIRGNYKLHRNEKSNGIRGDVWQGTYRIIPVVDLCGFMEDSIESYWFQKRMPSTTKLF